MSHQASINQTDNQFSINQIVKGKVCGVFVILGFHKAGYVDYVILKEVNPCNHAEHGVGEIRLPIDVIEPYYS